MPNGSLQIPIHNKVGQPPKKIQDALAVLKEGSPVLAYAIEKAPRMMEILYEISENTEAKHCDRISAITYFVNRAYGLPRKEVEFTSDGKDINITINGIPAGRVADPAPVIDRVVKKKIAKPRGRPKGSKNAPQSDKAS